MIIVYCLDSINGIGGIQRVTVTKANALAEVPGNEVWVIVADNSGRPVFALSPAVHFVDLQINYYEDDWKSRWNVLKGIVVKRRVHKRRLKEQLKAILPDVVISVGQSEKNVIPSIRGNWATVREFHFTRRYRDYHAVSFFNRLSAWCGNALDSLVLRKYDRIVVLTYEDKKLNWRRWNNVRVIYNPVYLSSQVSSLESKRIIAVGRLTYQKNFSSLIRAFKSVADRFPGWTLDIYGEGKERDALSAEIRNLGLDASVRLMGAVPDIQDIMPDYSIFAMTSRFEGFGLSLVEAMSCGLPAVSYACPCGPKDIIADGVNGFLVPEGDEEMLAERICRLIEHEDERKRIGQEAFKSSSRYALPNIIRQWMELFTELAVWKKS